VVFNTKVEFQSTRPRGARLHTAPHSQDLLIVSIHAPAWGATCDIALIFWSEIVSIHAPAWGATIKACCTCCRGNSFNPRARVGRDMTRWQRLTRREMFQSTRPRGARRTLCPRCEEREEFQSTRPRGARHTRFISVSKRMCFNPRARVGRDAIATDCPRCQMRFNPRARVGRDVDAIDAISQDLRFNPRARVGRDHDDVMTNHGLVMFQSTRPRGARLNCHSSLLSSRRCFNPRARVGRDQEEKAKIYNAIVSIHAPAWGATITVAKKKGRRRCFNPRARVGRDKIGSGSALRASTFQSTRPRGARLLKLLCR